MDIKVLGPGCARCNQTEKVVREVLTETGVNASIEKVTDIRTIAEFGVFGTPAVVVDGQVKSVGKIPSKEDVRKWVSIALCLVLIYFSSAAFAEDSDLDKYISKFSYQERKDMKITSKELLPLLKEQKVQFIDIRFKEEFEAWRMGFGMSIPINELPKRLNELDQNKVIVTACPHKDRATIAMVFLKTKGFNAKYLEDGLVGLAEALRGDTAREFVK